MAYGQTSSGKIHFFSVDKGQFRLYVKGADDKEAYGFVDGALQSVSVYDDQSERYGLRKKLRISLQDGEETLVIESGAKSTFSKMFCGYIQAVTPGEHIRIETSTPTERKDVSTCFVKTLIADGYQNVPYSKIQGSDEAAIEAAVVHTIMSHDAYKPYEPKAKDGSSQSSSGSSARDAVERLIAVIGKVGFPDHVIHKPAYEALFTRVLNRPLTFETLSGDEADRFADGFLKKEEIYKDRANWPAELAAIPADEYDPFADI